MITVLVQKDEATRVSVQARDAEHALEIAAEKQSLGFSIVSITDPNGLPVSFPAEPVAVEVDAEEAEQPVEAEESTDPIEVAPAPAPVLKRGRKSGAA